MLSGRTQRSVKALNGRNLVLKLLVQVRYQIFNFCTESFVGEPDSRWSGFLFFHLESEFQRYLWKNPDVKVRTREVERPSVRHIVFIKTFPLPTFCQIQEALRVEWRNSAPRYASVAERKNENIKYWISRVGIELTTCHVYTHLKINTTSSLF